MATSKKKSIKMSTPIKKPKKIATPKKSVKRQYRSNLSPIHSLFNEIRDKLTPRHREAMRKTPFKHLFDALDKEQLLNSTRKNAALDEILFCYDKKQKEFRFGKKHYIPTKMDVKLIFGIEDGKEEVKDMVRHKHDVSELKNRLFPNADKPTQNMIKERVMELVCKKDRTSIEDTVRLLCLLLFQSIFFANKGRSFAWGFLYFVADFKTLNSYDWSGHIISELYNGLNAEWDDPTHVNGCTLLLLYWFCEHDRDACDMYEKKMMGNKKPQIPRIKKWDMPDVEEAVKTIEALKKGATLRFNRKRLIPTPAEEKLILSLKDMNEADELSVSDEYDTEQEDLMGELEEKNNKIAELQQEVLRRQQQMDAERIDFQTKLDEEAALRMEIVSQLKKLEAENLAQQETIESQQETIESLRAQLHPPAPRGILRRNRRVTFNAQPTVFRI